MIQFRFCVSEPVRLSASLSWHWNSEQKLLFQFFLHTFRRSHICIWYISLKAVVAQFYVQLYILHMHKEPRAIGTHRQKNYFKTTHSFKIKGVANAKKCLPRLVDSTRAHCSMICCQYPGEAKLLFPFPDSASYILLSEIGEARVHRSWWSEYINRRKVTLKKISVRTHVLLAKQAADNFLKIHHAQGMVLWIMFQYLKWKSVEDRLRTGTILPAWDAGSVTAHSRNKRLVYKDHFLKDLPWWTIDATPALVTKQKYLPLNIF